MDWYAADNNLHGTLYGSQKKLMRAGHPHAVSGRPMLIITYHVMPMLRCALP
jgi:hypothetical protein